MIFHILDTSPYQILDLQIFLQVFGLSFHFLDTAVFRCIQLFNFDDGQFISRLLLVPSVAHLRNYCLIQDHKDFIPVFFF